jgi:hypothetical protein
MKPAQSRERDVAELARQRQHEVFVASFNETRRDDRPVGREQE